VIPKVFDRIKFLAVGREERLVECGGELAKLRRYANWRHPAASGDDRREAIFSKGVALGVAHSSAVADI